jgi:L-ascorbate metabolism protein UlaG (beta-lactamase superfamily)
MMEAMSLGGREKKGIVLAPADALGGADPVVYKYIRSYVNKIATLELKKKYRIGNLEIQAAVPHDHGVETYGLIIKGKKRTLSYITDTKYFSGLAKHYHNDVVIVSVLSVKPTIYDHLSADDAEIIIKELKPKVTILTHFGLWMITAKPWLVAEELSQKTKRKVVAASDGLTFAL